MKVSLVCLPSLCRSMYLPLAFTWVPLFFQVAWWLIILATVLVADAMPAPTGRLKKVLKKVKGNTCESVFKYHNSYTVPCTNWKSERYCWGVCEWKQVRSGLIKQDGEWITHCCADRQAKGHNPDSDKRKGVDW